MTIVYRSVKGSNLTPAEVDGNFEDLDDRVAALESNPVQANNISSIAILGSQMTITMDDASTFVVDVPVATFTNRGDWAAATAYAVNDIVNVAGAGLYLVLTAHTSEITFDANASDSTGEWYLSIFPAQTIAFPEVKTVSTATYEVVFTDPGTYIRCTNSSPNTAGVACEVNIGAAANSSIDVGSEIHFRESSGGSITFTATGGVSINSVTV